MSSTKITDQDLKILHKARWNKAITGAIPTLFLLFISFMRAGGEMGFDLLFYLLVIISFTAGAGTFMVLSRNISKDIRYGSVKLTEELVDKKAYEENYEPGSALFPTDGAKEFYKEEYQDEIRSGMREQQVYYIDIGEERIFVDKDIFAQIEEGKKVTVRRGMHSNIFLGLDSVSNQQSGTDHR